jgi:anti-sigma B factor antagonist
LLLKQGRRSMFSVELSTREWDGHVVVALDGELDLVDAADVAAALATVTAAEPEVIMDLAALEFIDSSGVAALVRGRAHARHAGGDLLLAAPQQQVLRILAITRLADNFSVHASVEEAAASARRSRRVVVPLRRPRRTRRLHTILPASPLPHSRTAEPMPVEDGPPSQSAARNTAKSAPAAVIPFPGCGDDR